MILAMMLALVAGQAAAPSPQPDDVVVIGERPKHFRIIRKKDRATGIRRCAIKPSSGDAIFDSGVCDTYTACALKAETASALEACMTPGLTELVKNWRERRAAATQRER